MEWKSLLANKKAKRSWHHYVNECQRSLNYIWLCNLCYRSGDWLQTSINEALAAFRGKTMIGHSLLYPENEP